MKQPEKALRENLDALKSAVKAVWARAGPDVYLGERFLPGSFVQRLLTLEQGVNNKHQPQGWFSFSFGKTPLIAFLGALLWALGKLDLAGGFVVLEEGQDTALAAPKPPLALTALSLLGQQNNSL